MTSTEADDAPAAPGDGAASRTPRRRPTVRRSQKAASTIAQRIVDDITDGDLERGGRLASERDMLARFEAGRGTLRESLRFTSSRTACRSGSNTHRRGEPRWPGRTPGSTTPSTPGTPRAHAGRCGSTCSASGPGSRPTSPE
ncbi:MAG: GntR family transcriptional regulator [Pseudonocardia sp.]|uniref:GntR family transcriptional regulator n=1 Tax=unclassified Pseudonocardia TaxID=2619320 RepID=UPI001ACAF789|nr:GntR family transcriptional regulator [Pseudonocardia sp.]